MIKKLMNDFMWAMIWKGVILTLIFLLIVGTIVWSII